MNKIKLILTLLVFVLLIFAANKIDRNYFSILEESFTSIYEDRLVVKDYLFKISRQLEEKKDYLVLDQYAQSKSINDSIDVLLDKFAATKLTARESQSLYGLQDNIENLYQLEREFYTEEALPAKENKLEQINQRYEKIWNNMLILSEIQLTEGKRLMSSSNQVFKSTNLLSYLEIGFLILIAIAFYFILVYKPSAK